MPWLCQVLASDVSWSPEGSRVFVLSTASNLILRLGMADRGARRQLTRVLVEPTFSVKSVKGIFFSLPPSSEGLLPHLPRCTQYLFWILHTVFLGLIEDLIFSSHEWLSLHLACGVGLGGGACVVASILLQLLLFSLISAIGGRLNSQVMDGWFTSLVVTVITPINQMRLKKFIFRS